MLDFTADMEMSALFSDLVAIRRVLEDQGDREAQLRQRIQERMGDATRALFETGDVSWKRTKDGSTTDMVALRNDHPALLLRYSQPKPGYRRFVVNV